MTDLSRERLAELRGFVEASIADHDRHTFIAPQTVLALIAQCEASLSPASPTVSGEDGELIKRLRADAKGTSAATKLIAENKSNRNREAAGKPLDGTIDYMWSEPEQTTAWKAADRIVALSRRVAELEGRE